MHIVAKSGLGTHALWSLRLYHDAVGGTWRAQFKVLPSTGAVEILAVDLDEDQQTTGLQFDDAAWHHLAGVYSAQDGVMELYLGGVLLASRSTSGVGLSESAFHGVAIGSRLNGAGMPIHGFKGEIDDVQIFSRRLWNWEIQEIVATTP